MLFVAEKPRVHHRKAQQRRTQRLDDLLNRCKQAHITRHIANHQRHHLQAKRLPKTLGLPPKRFQNRIRTWLRHRRIAASAAFDVRQNLVHLFHLGQGFKGRWHGRVKIRNLRLGGRPWRLVKLAREPLSK